MELNIHLVPKAKDIEAIYFKDGAFDVFESQATRRVRRGFLWVVPTALVLILLMKGRPNSGAFIGLATTAAVAQCLLLAQAFHRLLKQRRMISDFARDAERMGPVELRMTDGGFSLRMDGQTHMERWPFLQKATVADDHVALHASASYVLPKAGMEEKEFEALVNVVRSHTVPTEEDRRQMQAEKRPIGFKGGYDEGTRIATDRGPEKGTDPDAPTDTGPIL
ncbi:MAG TPA: hypothetical protein PKD45_02515 [Flavobacteriales bacterium]|nr:hypothetical protein [Flavobacteriales bacterium]